MFYGVNDLEKNDSLTLTKNIRICLPLFRSFEHLQIIREIDPEIVNNMMLQTPGTFRSIVFRLGSVDVLSFGDSL